MKGFKGFDENLKCQGFQYEVGKEYEMPENEVKICNKGFHFCENALDVLGYYEPTKRFAEVDGDGKIEKETGDSKVVCSKIHIKAELSLNALIGAGIKFILDKVDWKNAKESNTGYSSVATNTGNGSASTNTGNRSASTNTGDWSASTNTGDWSASTNTGDGSASTNTGDGSVATNTGDGSAAEVSGKQSIACGLGIENKARGKKGCWLVLTEWKEENNEWILKTVKSIKVDGKKIKEDEWYQLKNGKFVIVE